MPNLATLLPVGDLAQRLRHLRLDVGVDGALRFAWIGHLAGQLLLAFEISQRLAYVGDRLTLLWRIYESAIVENLQVCPCCSALDHFGLLPNRPPPCTLCSGLFL